MHVFSTCSAYHLEQRYLVALIVTCPVGIAVAAQFPFLVEATLASLAAGFFPALFQIHLTVSAPVAFRTRAVVILVQVGAHASMTARLLLAKCPCAHQACRENNKIRHDTTKQITAFCRKDSVVYLSIFSLTYMQVHISWRFFQKDVSQPGGPV